MRILRSFTQTQIISSDQAYEERIVVEVMRNRASARIRFTTLDRVGLGTFHNRWSTLRWCRFRVCRTSLLLILEEKMQLVALTFCPPAFFAELVIAFWETMRGRGNGRRYCFRCSEPALTREIHSIPLILWAPPRRYTRTYITDTS